MNTRRLVFAVGVSVALLLAGSLAGEDKLPVAEEVDYPILVLKEYDVAALLAEVPQHSFAHLMDVGERRWEMGGGAVSLFSDEEEEPAAADRLRGLIERSVRAEEPWESMGGRATLDFYEQAGKLMVSATEAGHQQIRTLLARLTAEVTTTFVVTIQAVELDATFADGLYDRGEFVARTDGQKTALKAAVKKTFVRTTLSGLNRQRVDNNSGRASRLVSDAEPVVAESVAAWDPTITAIPGGLAVAVKPTGLPDGERVLLDYGICYARLREMRRVVVESAVPNTPPAKVAIHLPVFDCDQRAGTVALPLGCPTVVTGGTVPASLVEDGRAGSVQLDYIVTVRRLGQ